ncbi:MAG: gas vesicle protein GvpO [Methanoregula sp.]|nr:gas vesicle protein GvpO [Methanoregula sp.]
MVNQVQEQVKKPKRLNMKQLLDSVKNEMVGLTSLPFNTIAGVAFDEETHMPIVTIELVERKAIPDTMDLLGIYEVITDEEGGVVTFKRISMRKRGDVVSATEY